MQGWPCVLKHFSQIDDSNQNIWNTGISIIILIGKLARHHPKTQWGPPVAQMWKKGVIPPFFELAYMMVPFFEPAYLMVPFFEQAYLMVPFFEQAYLMVPFFEQAYLMV
jgi:hypothetical protein